MPHQCVRCGTLYEDGTNDILKGCTCGAKTFFYIKKERLASKEAPFILTATQRHQIERDVYDIIGDEIDRERPIVLDLEAINILAPGKYELDLVNLFQKKYPLIYKLEDGKYMIDLVESFKKLREG